MVDFEQKFTDIDDCVEKGERSVESITLALIIVNFLVQLHFCCVVYTHWKNSHLSKARGGCEPNLEEGDIQMHS